MNNLCFGFISKFRGEIMKTIGLIGGNELGKYDYVLPSLEWNY